MKSKTRFIQLLLFLLLFTFSASVTFGQICGDINGDSSTNIVDALLVAQCYVGLISCPSADIGDVNCDGSINIVDALLIAQLYVGLIEELNCCGSPDTPTPTATPTPVTVTETPTPVTVTETPIPGQNAIPGIIEAEDYDRVGGSAETEPNNEPSGIHISYIQPGEWLEYDVNVQSGYYYIHFRTASASDASPNRISSLQLGGVQILGEIEFGLTSGWTTFETTTAGPISISSSGSQVFRVNFDGEGFNLDLIEFEQTSATPSPEPTPTPSPTPTPTCDGTCPPAVPLFLFAYEYDRAKDNDANNQGLRGNRTDGVDYEDNWQGGFNTGWVSGGEWLEWDADVANDGSYNVYVRAAHDDVGTLTGNIYINGELLGPVNVPNTDAFAVAHPPGNWQTWKTFEIGSLYLTSGINIVRLEHTGQGSFNLHYVYLGDSPPPEPTSVPRPGGYTPPINRYGRLQVNGSNVCSSSGSPVQLRGISAHDMRWHWLAAKHTIQNLAYTRGLELFRLVVYVDPGNYGYMADGHRDVLRQFFFAFMDDCVEAGIYAIIDWHVLKDNTPVKYQSTAVSFFTEVSQEYGSYAGTIFEICNEPNGPGWPEIKGYAEAVIPRIRSNSSNLIVVGNPSWSSQPDVASADPVSGSNIAYSMHFYAGSHGQDYRTRSETCIANGFPVFVTEWGTVDASGGGSPNFTASSEWVSWMASHNISWCNWAFCNKAEGASMLTTSAGFTGPWSSSDFTATGQWIFARF